ncbi:nodulation protein NfeD [Achromobacter sp. SD115]|uniref:NfeD family protein n=1 Tax=Achromobacter sp. SD115 TaxID=2782011 RepID=UPI001A95B4B5|nr:nodulation protein NfeD [Achromobacter sp. SD115]MBO1016848.1 nodulation protein NfeD [Achromobacter sp. SD115]
MAAPILSLLSRSCAMLRKLRRVAVLLAAAAICSGGAGAQPAGGPQTAVVLSLDGIVGPATADYVIRGLEAARQQNAAAVVLRIDTPGGLDASMRDIIRAILASPVPVISYVAPNGARAASAGTYILYASHVAAMAPATNLGAATPIALGGSPPRPADSPSGPADPADKKPPADKTAPAAPKDAGEAKAINDAVAYIRSLAALRGRNADWAEQAVRAAASLTAGEARAQNVIDLIADDVPDLLAKADGRRVRVGSAETTLHTRDLRLLAREPDWRTQVLSVITNPNLALLLLMAGVYGLIFEFMSPGALFPGIFGAICLLVGLYALAALPLTYAGIALVLLGTSLMVAEIFAPTLGVLGVGGAVSFVLGAILLIDTDTPAFGVSVPLMAGIAAASLGMTFLIGRLALRSRRAPVVSGAEALIGLRIKVLSWTDGQGYVAAVGERWRAVGPAGLAAGDSVVITAVRGVTLHVQPDTGLPPSQR